MSDYLIEQETVKDIDGAVVWYYARCSCGWESQCVSKFEVSRDAANQHLFTHRTIEEILAESDFSHVYTREIFLADLERLTKRLCQKHGIQASEIPELIRTHNYTHTAEDPEDEWMEIMAFARVAGWPEAE